VPKAWHDEKLEDIKANPSKHQHSYEALIRCSTNPDGAIDTDVMDAHSATVPQRNRGCDVLSGPCGCGAWH